MDIAFEKWRAKRSRAQMVNSIAYCTQAVMTEAQRMADAGSERAEKPSAAPFPEDDLRRYIENNAALVRGAGTAEYTAIADSLDEIVRELTVHAKDLEALEQRLSMLEQKMIAVARSRETEEQALAARRDLESYLRPWRSKMTAPQIAMLEGQFRDRATLEGAGLPRLSLFHLR